MTLLDTNIVLYALADRLEVSPPMEDVAISVITEIELLSYQGLTASEESEIRNLLPQLQIVQVTEEVKNEAIALRRRNRLKLADAIVVASALTIGAELMANDLSVTKIRGVRFRPVHVKADEM